MIIVRRYPDDRFAMFAGYGQRLEIIGQEGTAQGGDACGRLDQCRSGDQPLSRTSWPFGGAALSLVCARSGGSGAAANTHAVATGDAPQGLSHGEKTSRPVALRSRSCRET